MSKEIITHKDILGNPILPESKLAVAHHNMLMVCSITKITPKMMRVTPINKGTYYKDHSGYLVYPNDCVVVDGPEVTAYILRGGAA